MDATFTEFIAKAKRLGLCQEYTDKVDNAGSKKAFMDIALDANAMPWLCESICKGWGLTPEYISKEFAPFNNGRYIRKDGYTSTMYCLPAERVIKINTTAALIIGFMGVVEVDRPVAELYIVKSDCGVVAPEGSKVNVCLYDSSVINNGVPNIVKDKRYGAI